jgi:probable rRNA maturation factor
MKDAYRIDVTSMVRTLPLASRKIDMIVRTVLAGQKIRRAEISVAVVGDKRMADFAEQYVHKRYRTDVFSFDLGKSTESQLLGQLIVNSQLARDKAKKFKVESGAELALYIVHGLLHLCGYDDHRVADAVAMHKQTHKYLLKLGFKHIPPMPEV